MASTTNSPIISIGYEKRILKNGDHKNVNNILFERYLFICITILKLSTLPQNTYLYKVSKAKNVGFLYLSAFCNFKMLC